MNEIKVVMLIGVFLHLITYMVTAPSILPHSVYRRRYRYGGQPVAAGHNRLFWIRGYLFLVYHDPIFGRLNYLV